MKYLQSFNENQSDHNYEMKGKFETLIVVIYYECS